MTEPGTPSTSGSAARLPGWAIGIARFSAICLGLGVMFAWFGVYSTAEIPMPERIVYWTILMTVGYGSAIIVNPLIFDRWMPESHPALQIAVVACLISIPVTIGLILIEYVSSGQIQDPSWWWTRFGYVIVISALLTAGGWAIGLLGKKAAPVPAGAPLPGSAATVPAPAPLVFADRLPAKFRSAEIHAVSAEDHYLRVHTSVGETMILMRLADAIRELAALEGLQTHRSWWVARQGLADVTKGDGRVTLKLKSGVEAPVSRANLKVVKDAGWL
jgi:hypothetical protein